MSRALALALLVGCGTPDLATTEVRVITHVDVDRATVLLASEAPCLVATDELSVRYGGLPMRVVLAGTTDHCDPVELEVALDGSPLASSDVVLADPSATITATFPEGVLQAPRLALATTFLAQGTTVHAAFSPAADLALATGVEAVFVATGSFTAWSAPATPSTGGIDFVVPAPAPAGAGELYIALQPQLRGAATTCGAKECSFSVVSSVSVPAITALPTN